MAKNHTQYIFSMSELKRKDNSIDFYNSKGHNYIPIEDLKEHLISGDLTSMAYIDKRLII